VIAYDDSVKIKLLGVSPALLKNHGAVSDNAPKPWRGRPPRGGHGYRNRDHGIAGPDGGTKAKPWAPSTSRSPPGSALRARRLLMHGARETVLSRPSPPPSPSSRILDDKD